MWLHSKQHVQWYVCKSNDLGVWWFFMSKIFLIVLRHIQALSSCQWNKGEGAF